MASKVTQTDLLGRFGGSRTLTKHPRLNGSWVNAGIRLNPEVNVGIAMAVEGRRGHGRDSTPRTLFAGRDRKTSAASLTERARANRLRPSRSCRRHVHHPQPRYVPGRLLFTAIIAPAAGGDPRGSGAITDRVVPVERRHRCAPHGQPDTLFRSSGDRRGQGRDLSARSGRSDAGTR